MATILEFRRAAEPTSRVTGLKDGIPGQVIIFPGVRIERQAWEGRPTTTDTSRKRAQRGRKKQR
jgi:hypothetical protein